MRVRSVTLHLGWSDDLSIAERFLDAAREAGALTLRVSVSPPPPRYAEEVINKLKNLGAEYISALHLYYGAEDLHRLVSLYGVFGTLNDVVEYLRFLKIIHLKGEVHLSRYVSLLVGEPTYNSPYFPASITTERGISISLLYPNDLEKIEDVERVLKRGEDVGRYIAETLGLKFLGVDGSLSPWGEESVARAVERLFGVRLGDVGSHHAIYTLNKAIAAASVKKVGFNEVMLPLAEDEELKRLVVEGALDLAKLVSYIPVCVPGLDMAPIKVTDWGRLKRLLYDVASLATSKRRPVGVRIFPVEVDEYYVEGFGKTPALDLT
ncbi:DUF711 family protein [Pyrobaculum neutrophilum]|uniref:DUF711 domain-containing protein n=1 Tax=Pyrobaculum neutrophilum (strain DSM 2338 / JCM 9278 / NBRC 100436 / V24Sta) TaxID=444157 RepID=B1Y938_PYRNV|nr:DUF711 family protein [Pyrobaculum neutrophilum]ACB40267.1 protein of unknown function DUF711 [Pyrobaculum neutrophilum V24Sta]